jgi:hypothetical protein
VQLRGEKSAAPEESESASPPESESGEEQLQLGSPD